MTTTGNRWPDIESPETAAIWAADPFIGIEQALQVAELKRWIQRHLNGTKLPTTIWSNAVGNFGI